MSRRAFLQAAAWLVGSTAALGASRAPDDGEDAAPGYLAAFADLHQLDAAGAGRAWFAEAGLGLMVQLGLYSMLGRGESVMLTERIPVRDYASLADHFFPDRFDAEQLADAAVDAGARYIVFTARHFDGFCLFDSQFSDFTSTTSSARRDLVAELSTACQKRGLGLGLYYAYALDWRHPYFYSREVSPLARARAGDPDSKWTRDADFHRYTEFAAAQIAELLTSYGPIAGVWLDPPMGYFAKPELFPIREMYAMVRRLQPQCLIAFDQGVTGTEDFTATARGAASLPVAVQHAFDDPSRTALAQRALESNRSKRHEVRESLQTGSWGYRKVTDATRLDGDAVWGLYQEAASDRSNLLLSAGLLGDGSVHDSDARALREIGRRIRAEGRPGASGARAAR
ncbi:MAG: alpha-L-fucosidase [Phycisphaerales bacterium]|nr:alpha-L-fucosidase [Phycisphaerales bacterium]